MALDPLVVRTCGLFPEVFCAPGVGSPGSAKYEISAFLGKGAAGSVFRCKRFSDGLTFAVKLRDLDDQTQAQRNAAMMEMNCMKQCNFYSVMHCHEDFVKYNDAGEPVTMAIVVDLADCGDLRQELKRRSQKWQPFLEGEAGLMFVQLLMAVHHIHQRNILHRDIKTANILLDHSGLLKLGDFGLSKLYSESPNGMVGETICGTPNYLAPELWQRQRYSSKAEVFSMGIVLYELLSLNRPFRSPDRRQLMNEVLSGKYPPLPTSVSDEMRAIVDSMLSLNPSLRPSTAELLNMPLFKLMMASFKASVMENDCLSEDMKKKILNDCADSVSLPKPAPQLCQTESEAPLFLGVNDDNVQTLSAQQVPTATVGAHDIIFGDSVKKLSGDGRSWKNRYLGITKDCLVLAVSQKRLDNEQIVYRFSDIEDVFAVPTKYTAGHLPNVFSVVLRSLKMVCFQASSSDQQAAWVKSIHDALEVVM